MEKRQLIKIDLVVGRLARRVAWPLGLISLTVATTLWSIHVWMTYRYPPYANRTDELLWIWTSVFRGVAIICLPLIFSQAFRGMRRSGYYSVKLAVMLFIFGLSGLITLYEFRDSLILALNNSVTRFYPSSLGVAAADSRLFIDLDKNVARIQSGWVFAEEAIGLIIFIGGLIRIGRLHQPLFVRGLLAWLWLPLGALLVNIVCGFFFPIMIMDYDCLLLGMFFPPFILDCLDIMSASDPSSSIALPALLLFCLVTWGVSRSHPFARRHPFFAGIFPPVPYK